MAYGGPAPTPTDAFHVLGKGGSGDNTAIYAEAAVDPVAFWAKQARERLTWRTPFTKTLEWDLLLPATACGLLATAVLNINNVRDIETDAVSGKITLAVRLGRNRAIAYHWLLLGAALVSTIAAIDDNAITNRWVSAENACT